MPRLLFFCRAALFHLSVHTCATKGRNYYSAPVRGAEYCDQLFCLSVWLSVCPWAYLWSLEPLDRSLWNFLQIPIAVTRSPSGGIVIRYVLPVLWMTSCLAVMGCMAMRGRLTPNLLPLAVLQYLVMSVNAFCMLLHAHMLPVFFATDQLHRPPRSSEIQPIWQQDASETRPYRGLVLNALFCRCTVALAVAVGKRWVGHTNGWWCEICASSTSVCDVDEPQCCCWC